MLFAPSLLHRILYLLLFLMLGSGAVGCGTSSEAALANHLDSTPIFSTRSFTPVSKPTVVPDPDPQRLVIPLIGVDAPIENVTILSNGDLATPTKNPWTGTGWYEGGTRPGEQGSAVIDGHLNRPGNVPAVFWRLHELKPGDEVRVVTSAGKTLRYSVTAVEYYEPEKAPLQLIFANTSGKYLNLITCAGDWISSKKQTTLRLVVYTTLK